MKFKENRAVFFGLCTVVKQYEDIRMAKKIKRKQISIQRKQIRGNLLMVIVMMAVLIPSISFLYKKMMEKEISENAFNIAGIAAEIINGDVIKSYEATEEKDDYYYEIKALLNDMKVKMGFKYFYVVIPYDGQMVYIWDAGDETSTDICDLGDRDDYYGNGQEVMQDAFNNIGKKVILVTNSAKYGYIASAYVPIIDSTGKSVALASVDIPMDKINIQIKSFVLTISLIVFLILMFSQIIHGFYVKRTIVDARNKLSEAVVGLVDEDLDKIKEFNVDIHTRDEIEELSEAFSIMTEKLHEYIENLTVVTKEKERIGTELNVATQIQADMLPRIFPPYPDYQDRFDLYAIMNPAKEVGGDFYDFFLIDDNHLAIVMADVSGKGVPAALFMVIAKTLLKNRAYMGGSPSEILADVNNQLCEGNEAELFVTVFLGIIDLDTGDIVSASAGHEYPIYYRKNQDAFVMEKDKHGPPLATMEDMTYRETKNKLEHGDAIYIYTDGVTEATNNDNELFGDARVIESLNKLKNKSSEEVLIGVRKDIDTFVGTAPQFDDITMLCLRYF